MRKLLAQAKFNDFLNIRFRKLRKTIGSLRELV